MTTKHDEFSLDAKYTQEDGTVFLSGIQALVRLPLDQHRADRRRGLRTATFISGYRGSPLGGLDQTLERYAKTNLPEEAQKAVAKAIDEIGFRTEFKQRLVTQLNAWIEQGTP